MLAVVDGFEGDPVESVDPLDPDFAGGVLASLLVLVPSPGDDSEAPSPPSPAAAVVAEAGLARRSFLAQPDPLKWTAGAENALRTGPEPHSGQTVGGSSCSPWIVSNRRPHAAQS